MANNKDFSMTYHQQSFRFNFSDFLVQTFRVNRLSRYIYVNNILVIQTLTSWFTFKSRLFIDEWYADDSVVF